MICLDQFERLLLSASYTSIRTLRECAHVEINLFALFLASRETARRAAGIHCGDPVSTLLGSEEGRADEVEAL